ncbi:MAG TPA: D-alanine--D-alanine ligase [Patescibacteria group bacterium]|nr:D-alanine--D-alanine ligase [Patescibacteria group bacterium]
MELEANRYGRIGVLMGGPSTEREISLKSGKAVYEHLCNAGFEVVAIDVTTDDRQQNIELIHAQRIQCAFLALHGRFGEDGQIQEILDTLRIPYTGPGALASKLAMDKVASRRIFERHGLDVPRYKVLDEVSYAANSLSGLPFCLPVVVKPASHGSSIGLSIVDDPAGLGAAIEEAFRYDRQVILEEYIHGREVTVGILDEQPLPVIEIIPKRKFFDYEAKYKPGMTEYVVPAQLDEQIASKIQAAALSAYRLLGCVGCSRVDIILDGRQRPFVLEVNTIPGLTATSLLPKAAMIIGIDFTRLCLRLLDLAYEKTKTQAQTESAV